MELIMLIMDIFKAGFYILITCIVAVITPLILVMALLISAVFVGRTIFKLIVEEIKKRDSD